MSDRFLAIDTSLAAGSKFTSAATRGEINFLAQQIVNVLTAGAPSNLNTFAEVATALNNDPALYTTLSALIAAKYTKPGGGIPSTDLTSAVQAALALASTAVQPGGPEGVAVAAQELLLGNGDAEPITVVHNMGTLNVTLVVRRVASPRDQIFTPRNELPDSNTITIIPGEVWETGEYRGVLTGYVGIGDVTPPTPPTIAFSSKSASSITVTVSGATDAVGVIGYKFYRDGALVGSSPSAGFTYTGLSATTAYALRATATDAAGLESTLSNTITITTSTPVSVARVVAGTGQRVTSGSTAVDTVTVSGTNPALLVWLGVCHGTAVNDGVYTTLTVSSNVDGLLTKLAGAGANQAAVVTGAAGSKQGSLTPFGKINPTPGAHTLTATVTRGGTTISSIQIQANVYEHVGAWDSVQVQDAVSTGALNFTVTGADVGDMVAAAHVLSDPTSGYNRTPLYNQGAVTSGQADYMVVSDAAGASSVSFTDTATIHRNASVGVIIGKAA